MLVFAALLGFGLPQAHAEGVLRPLHRCEALLSTPSGDRIPVPAWGASETQAMEQAHRVGRFLASQDLAADLIPGLLAESDTGQVLLLDRLGVSMGDSMVGVPGYQLIDGACRVYTEGQTRKDHGWVVSWTAGEAERISGSNVASAIETARRRACVPVYQSGLEQVLRDLTQTSGEERDGMAQVGFVDALESLVVCLTRAQPKLAAGLERMVDSVDGVVECAASRMSVEGEWRSVRAWGTELEWTAETASWELTLLQARRGLAESMNAVVRGPPPLRRMGISSGAARLTRMTASSQELEQAGISCVLLPAQSGQELVWKPSDVDVAERCGPLQSWMGRKVLLQPETAWTESRYRSCQQMVHQSSRDADDAIAKAVEGAVVFTALKIWEHRVHCGARCSGDIERTPTDGERPLRLSTQPEVWSHAQVQSLLQQAISDRNAEQFEICVPAVASFRAVMVAQPERFWSDMSMMARTGQFYEIFGWEQYRDRWYLMPQE